MIFIYCRFFSVCSWLSFSGVCFFDDVGDDIYRRERESEREQISEDIISDGDIYFCRIFQFVYRFF